MSTFHSKNRYRSRFSSPSGPTVIMHRSRRALAVGNTLSQGLPLPGCGALSKRLLLLVLGFLVCKMRGWGRFLLAQFCPSCEAILSQWNPSHHKMTTLATRERHWTCWDQTPQLSSEGQ